jgi:hypothetical protein
VLKVEVVPASAINVPPPALSVIDLLEMIPRPAASARSAPPLIKTERPGLGLHRHVIRIVDTHPVALVAGDPIVKSKGILIEGAPDQRVIVRVRDGDPILSVAQGEFAGPIRADKVAAQQIARCGAVDQNPIGQIPGDEVALRRSLEDSVRGNFTAGRVIDPDRLTANEIP